MEHQLKRDAPVGSGIFLKWAGGKRWLAELSRLLCPGDSAQYIEPFLGSGAMFFCISPANATLSDCNVELISTYQAIKANYSEVCRHLAEHHRLHSREYYYAFRRKLPEDPFARASAFIYLNRVCWNGLYRVNRRGEFNVPLGSKTSVLLKSDDFERASSLLSRAKMQACDFEVSIDSARSGDVVFADPPYTVRHNLNGFVKYNENLFSWSDQIRLRDALVRADLRGVRVVCTNADHETVRALYGQFFEMSSISRFSSISSNRTTRGRFSELIISNLPEVLEWTPKA